MYELKSVTQLLNEVKSLRGASVSVFGQPTVLSEGVDENDLLIDTVDVLEVLRDYDAYSFMADLMAEYNVHADEPIEDVLDFIYMMQEGGRFSEDKHDNTYNWSAPLSHDIDFMIFDDQYTDETLVSIRVHMYGDVRGNYTDVAVMKFDDIHQFDEVFFGMTESKDVPGTGGRFAVTVELMSDEKRVYDYEAQDEVHTSYAYDMEDLVKELKDEGILEETTEGDSIQ